MRFTKTLKLLTFALGVAFLGVNCSSSNDSGESVMISGRVDTNSQSKVVSNEATVVSAGYINSSGEIETIEGTETEISSTGSYTVAFDAEAYQNIVVVATSGSQTWTGYVEGSVENGSEYTIKPIDVESSAETMVYSELVADGNAEMIHKSEIEAVVTADIASEVHSSSSTAAKIATGLYNAARVRAEYFESQFEGEADAKMSMAADAMIDAQVELESRLDAASDASDVEGAYTTFFSAMSEVYLDAELEANQSANLIEMWGRVFVNSTATVSSDVRNEMNTQVSLFTSIVVDKAVRLELAAANAEQATMEWAETAGNDLKASITASAGVRSEIEAAFEAYHDDIKAAMENDAGFSSTVIVSIDSEINSSTGAKSSFESSIAATISADLVLNIYNSFYTSVETTVESNNEISDAEVEVITDLMILINTSA